MPFEVLRRFLRLQAAAGLLLVLSATLAVVLANLPATRDLYASLLRIPFRVTVGSIELDKNLLLVVNDGLMAIFFLLVGLEIKRELVVGELRELTQIVMPAFAAAGGVIVPAGIYWLVNRTDPVALGGWAIPAATDIAFALGALSLFGKRVPLSLKVFLTTVAIVDDLAAILIIAIFYTGNLSALAFAVAGGCLVILLLLNRAGVTNYGGYILIGTVLWVAVVKSGVHATLAGVLLAFFIPLRPQLTSHDCPARRLEHALHPWVAYGVLTLFAFANAGVSLAGVTAEQATSGVSMGILLGLFVGKPVGVGLFGGVAIALGLGSLPRGSTPLAFLGVAALSGIGFTMSLFIGTLAFDEQGLHYEVATRLGVFGGSIASALLGAVLLQMGLPKSAEGSSLEGGA